MSPDPRTSLAPFSRAPASQPPAVLVARPARWRAWLCLLAVLAGAGAAGGASAPTFSFKGLGSHTLPAFQAQPAATTPSGTLKALRFRFYGGLLCNDVNSSGV